MKYPTFFTPDQQRLLTSLREQDRRERDTNDRARMRVRAVSAEVAQFLHLMVLHNSARTIVEFGTSSGYSAIHLAAAARRTGGRVLSVDADPEKTAWARQNLQDAGLADLVDLHTADGADFARGLPDGLDLVFIDFGVGSLIPHLESIKQKMSPRGLLFVDGHATLEAWQEHPDWMALERDFEADPAFVLWIMPMHKRHLTAVKL